MQFIHSSNAGHYTRCSAFLHTRNLQEFAMPPWLILSSEFVSQIHPSSHKITRSEGIESARDHWLCPHFALGHSIKKKDCEPDSQRKHDALWTMVTFCWRDVRTRERMRMAIRALTKFPHMLCTRAIHSSSDQFRIYNNVK